jgi:hypothetical protein
MVAAAALMGATSSHAGFAGTIYEGFGTGDVNFDQFILDNFGPQGPVGSFNATLVDYGPDSGQSFNSWLNYAGQNDGASLGGGIGGDQATNFYMRISGSILLNSGVSNFGLYSDDGAQLYIDGNLVVDNNGAHGPQFVGGSFFDVFTEIHHLDLVYDECCGGEAVLYATLNDHTLTGTPEPATWTLMIGGFLGAGAALRRARKQTAAA